jgi:PhnB protein
MIVPQLYLNERCCEAMEIYKRALQAELDSILYDPERKPEKFVIHAEMHIHGQRVMLSDWGGTKVYLWIQLCSLLFSLTLKMNL